MNFTDSELLELVPRGDTRAVSYLISLSENSPEHARGLLSALPKKPLSNHVIGITGAPGVGKSTLIDGLACWLRDRGHKVAILAIDPSSPFSGGAILGDRIRMSRVMNDSQIYMRSMASRGAMGGLAKAAGAAVEVLKAAGYRYILVETVGVGQAEVEIMHLAQTCLVLLIPGMGDTIQALKAGILEIAHIFVINKGDHPGCDAVERDLKLIVSLDSNREWLPRICRTVATLGQGLNELTKELLGHEAWLHAAGAARPSSAH